MGLNPKYRYFADAFFFHGIISPLKLSAMPDLSISPAPDPEEAD
jgi:hypothetical protein